MYMYSPNASRMRGVRWHFSFLLPLFSSAFRNNSTSLLAHVWPPSTRCHSSCCADISGNLPFPLSLRVLIGQHFITLRGLYRHLFAWRVLDIVRQLVYVVACQQDHFKIPSVYRGIFVLVCLLTGSRKKCVLKIPAWVGTEKFSLEIWQR